MFHPATDGEAARGRAAGDRPAAEQSDPRRPAGADGGQRAYVVHPVLPAGRESGGADRAHRPEAPAESVTRDPEQGLDVGFVGVCREGIDQKDEGGESSFDDTRADLLITTQGTGGNGFDLGQAPEPRGPAEDPTNDIRRVAGSHDSHAAERFGLSLQTLLSDAGGGEEDQPVYVSVEEA